MARLDSRGMRPSPSIEPGRPSVEESGDKPNFVALETFHIRAGPTPTTLSRQPTTSTPYAVPLTTTFIPPDSCNQGQLTMLSSPGYQIWFNEPVPVPGSTISDCYPPEFLQYYTTYRVNPTTVGSRVPMMSPLVCPFNWEVVSGKGDYQACCPVGYKFTPPETALDSNRPAYGGTCYSDWTMGSSTYVTVFGSTSLSGSMWITASTSGFANYAHVIDGIAAATSSSPSSTSHSSSSTESASRHIVSQAKSGVSARMSLSTGARAGIVVGIVVAVGLLGMGGYVFARRRRRSALPPAPPMKDEVGMSTVSSPTLTDGSVYSPIIVKRTQSSLSEMDTRESHVHELEARQIAVEKP
ncbi:hypothetical protein HD806DRAFT_537825 [Xylariaceae sp. AK1471]|nr:hypothetical protein HD806DRAFT_537825 [Xylariaceae sp. AK1471]